MKLLLIVAMALFVSTGCGGSDADESAPTDNSGAEGSDDSEGSSGEGSSNEVVNPAPSGQATASVDGQQFTLELPAGLDCSISEEALTFGYSIGDNEVTLGGGANRDDDGWIGSIRLTVANPDSEPGPISYYPKVGDGLFIDGSYIAVDGDSMSYSGPMEKKPANDGTNPPAVDVGDGTISATC